MNVKKKEHVRNKNKFRLKIVFSLLFFAYRQKKMNKISMKVQIQ